mgnify:CR=1 FL=1
MKICVIGDLHIKKKNLSLWDHILQELLEIIKNEKIDMLISTGDTLDTHERIDLRSLCAAKNFYLTLAQKCQVYVLVGNHDRENNRDYLSDIHPFVGLSSATLHIIAQPKVVTAENVRFMFVPYVPRGQFSEALLSCGYNVEKPDENRPYLIFAHQEFRGCKMNSVVSQKGDPWDPKLPTIISGHIHEYEQINNIIYVGTPFQHDYNESTDKGLFLLDMDMTVGRIQTNRIPLRCVTRKITVPLQISDLPHFANIIPANNAISGKDMDLCGKTLVKVVIDVDSSDIRTLKASEHYKSLCQSVDKVDLKINNNKANHAVALKKKIQNEGKTVTLEEIIKNMLLEDPYTLELFSSLL